jgi:hypothetical protein
VFPNRGWRSWRRDFGGKAARGVAVARATPGVRVVAIAASGLAALPLMRFVSGLPSETACSWGAHFAAGLIVGPSAIALVAGSAAPILILFGGLAVIGAAGLVADPPTRTRVEHGGRRLDRRLLPRLPRLGVMGRVDA